MHCFLVADCSSESLQSRGKAHQQFYMEKMCCTTVTALSMQWIFSLFRIPIQLLLEVIKRILDLLNQEEVLFCAQTILGFSSLKVNTSASKSILLKKINPRIILCARNM